MEKLNKREKIMIGITAVSLGVAGYFGIKYMNTNNLLKLTNKDNKAVKDRLDLLEFLVIESECVPKALQNAENKLARKETKIKDLCDRLISRPNDPNLKDAINKHEKEADILRKQIAKTVKLNDLISKDENIYAN